MEILGIILARKGSKRLPNKNKRLLNGKPMVSYSIEAGMKSKYITDVVVSSDDPDVIKIAMEYGVYAFDRPDKLAQSDTSAQDTIDYVIKNQLKKKYDFTVLLQPTSPLRTHEHIDRCIEMYMNTDFDSVITVVEIAPIIYRPNGCVYVFKDKIYQPNTGFFLMPKEESVDVDTFFDFKMAEAMMNDNR